MAVTKRMRFEVFKRDDFACQYCGRRPPLVVLEVDHIVPRAEGGGDDPENLVTSCFDCNRGKGSVPLDSRTAVADLAERTRLMREREEQVRAYNDLVAERRRRRATEATELEGHWEIRSHALYGRAARAGFRPGIIERFLKSLAYEDIIDAMNIAIEQKGPEAGIPYTIGILRNWRDRGRS